jgi:hypothetical protein
MIDQRDYLTGRPEAVGCRFRNIQKVEAANLIELGCKLMIVSTNPVAFSRLAAAKVHAIPNSCLDIQPTTFNQVWASVAAKWN